MVDQINTIQDKPRLYFIDMARSIAILLMIEGHFTGSALSWEYRKYEFFAYKFWHILHGVTSPLFFTVTGIIFVYLLTARGQDVGYFQNPRVKKGFKRVLTLLFWGYLIQLNLGSIIKSIYYSVPIYLDWFYAFHVLQSIAIGLFILLVIYGLYKLIKIGPFYIYCLLTAIVIFILYSMLKTHIEWDNKLIANNLLDPNHRRYLPENAPSFIQNMFYGKFSDFNFLQYSGYTILGGMIGNLIRIYEKETKKWWFGASFIAVGIIFNFIVPMLYAEHLISREVFISISTYILRLGQVIGLIGILMLIDANIKIRATLFLKLGQNTLPIYIVHVIILYGGIFGLGLKPLLFNEDLNPYFSMFISLSAIIVFSVMVYFIEPLETMYIRVINKLFFWR